MPGPRQQYKQQICNELGVQIGSKEFNRNQPTAYFGQIGGEMVRRALSQVWQGDTDAITPNTRAFYPANNMGMNNAGMGGMQNQNFQ